MEISKRRNLFLINLGSPEAPRPMEVGKYLTQFLMDPFVIDISWPLRLLLVKGLIVPKRKHSAAAAYEKIWMPEGSPLVHFTKEFAEALGHQHPGWEVRWGMRYGKPNMVQMLSQWLKETDLPIDVIPLYPQFAKSSTSTCWREVEKLAKSAGAEGRIRVLQDFYDQAAFIESFSMNLKASIESFRPDQILYSFHGLPEHHVQETDSSRAHCLKSPQCCAQVQAVNRRCYRAQCFATARAISQALNLPRSSYLVSFQSRLGRRPWIKPYTDVVLQTLAKEGKQRVLVGCPSFVADCLETLEEIQIRARDDFRAMGGDDLQLVPALNASSHWVKGFGQMMNSKNLEWKSCKEWRWS